MDHDKGRKLINVLADCLNYCSLPYFAIQGTALGMYRDKGFTPTEKDIDLGFLLENLDSGRLAVLIKLLTSNGLDIELFVRPFNRVRTIVVWGDNAHADIVGFGKHKDKRYTAIPDRPWIKEPYCIVHPAHIMENYQQVQCFGRTWNVPSPIEGYLEGEYGSGWRTPKDDSVSRRRVYNYLKAEGIVNGNPRT